MKAYVNHGRWVADCDTPHCAEAAVVEPGDAFLCGNCDRSYMVEWPTEKTLIDAALRMRQVAATRNWLPGETVNDLLAENDAHPEGVN